MIVRMFEEEYLICTDKAYCVHNFPLSLKHVAHLESGLVSLLFLWLL